MCLAEVKGVPKKAEGLGWKVFEIIKASGKLRPTHQNRSAVVYDYGVWYQATSLVQKSIGAAVPLHPLRTEQNGRDFKTWYENRQEYRNGFHIFLRREDARDYVSRNPNGVVRQVQYRQAHTLGVGTSRDQYREAASGPQVVAEEIMILKPRAGGSAYAKAKKAEKQVPAATV